MNRILLTTANLKQPYEIQGVLFSVTTEGLHAGLDWMAGWKNVLGGRVKGYERNVKKGLKKTMQDLRAQAKESGCHAVIGITHRIESIPVHNHAALVISLSGTGVKLLSVPSAGKGGVTIEE